MSFYMNTSGMLKPISLDRVLKPADHAIKADGRTKPVVVNSTTNDEASFAVLTLDDFGGRSDALGG
jgi:hypothetical protein